MKKLNIAVIGGGGAGSTAAWALHKVHNVTLFEAESVLGGHAFSQAADMGNGSTAHIDMGVEYFSERLSPNLCALLKIFDIETFVTPLSIRVLFAGEKNFWSNVTSEGALREQLNDELDRFHAAMADVLASADPRYKTMSVGDFLEEKGYSTAFKYKALLPLLTTFSGCNAPSLDYTLIYTAFSFNVNLLSFFSAGYWRKAQGGITGYLGKIARQLGGRVKTNCPVKSVRKNAGKPEVLCTKGDRYAFDHVVFATHADQTLAMIASPSEDHKKLLGGFEYVDVKSVLHKDEGILIKPNHHEYCEFSMPPSFNLDEGRHCCGSLTRISNNLLPYRSSKVPLLVTFDPRVPIHEEKIIAEKQWKLPKLRPEDIARKTQLRAIQGVDNLWFCGTDTSLTGHEGAIVSGLVIAARLGAQYPFANETLAKIQFNIIKDIMGVRPPREKITALTSDFIFHIAKRLSLHKHQSHKILKDFIA